MGFHRPTLKWVASVPNVSLIISQLVLFQKRAELILKRNSGMVFSLLSDVGAHSLQIRGAHGKRQRLGHGKRDTTPTGLISVDTIPRVASQPWAERVHPLWGFPEEICPAPKPGKPTGRIGAWRTEACFMNRAEMEMPGEFEKADLSPPRFLSRRQLTIPNTQRNR